MCAACVRACVRACVCVCVRAMCAEACGEACVRTCGEACVCACYVRRACSGGVLFVYNDMLCSSYSTCTPHVLHMYSTCTAHVLHNPHVLHARRLGIQGLQRQAGCRGGMQTLHRGTLLRRNIGDEGEGWGPGGVRLTCLKGDIRRHALRSEWPFIIIIIIKGDIRTAWAIPGSLDYESSVKIYHSSSRPDHTS